ncbi:hypothetical protein [Salmonella enterica]|uniref:hypothetical protein n=1 Tax=Salmonella enterica TaxID=28901 RepID=UPI00159228FE|nr:hypothetical protein [Salmonella enterica]
MKSLTPKFHTRYAPPPSPGVVFEEPTMTQQHFRDECDVNKIVERAIRTGDATVFTSDQRGEFYDAGAITDYADAMAMIDDVNDDFNSLPSALRFQFDNSVSKYVEWMCNPLNWDKARELGLLSGGETPEGSPSVPAPASPREREQAEPANNDAGAPASPEKT